MSYTELSACRNCLDRVTSAWPGFRYMHRDRLRHGGESEKVAEGILENLFTSVLDWSRGDRACQIEYPDIALSHNLAKYLVIEVKHPGSLARSRPKPRFLMKGESALCLLKSQIMESNCNE